MTTSEFKKIARILKEVYAQLEKEALEEGISLLSPEYDQLVARAREAVLANNGFTLQEYREAKAKVAGFSQADLVDQTERTSGEVGSARQMAEEALSRHIPTEEEIEAIAKRVADAVVKPPTIINQIVEKTTIEKPKIVKETIKVKEEYNDTPLRKELGLIKTLVENIDIPEPVDVEGLRKEFVEYFAQSFKKNIDTLGMPDFRQLGMGLRQDLDTKIEGVNTDKITVSTTAPTNPQLYDIWIDIS